MTGTAVVDRLAASSLRDARMACGRVSLVAYALTLGLLLVAGSLVRADASRIAVRILIEGLSRSGAWCGVSGYAWTVRLLPVDCWCRHEKINAPSHPDAWQNMRRNGPGPLNRRVYALHRMNEPVCIPCESMR